MPDSAHNDMAQHHCHCPCQHHHHHHHHHHQHAGNFRGVQVTPYHSVENATFLKAVCMADPLYGFTTFAASHMANYAKYVQVIINPVKIISGEMANFQRTRALANSIYDGMAHYFPMLETINLEHCSAGRIINRVTAGTQALYGRTLGVLPSFFHGYLSSADNILSILQCLSDRQVDINAVRPALVPILRRNAETFAKKNQKMMMNACQKTVNDEVKIIKKMLENAKGVIPKELLIKALNHKYKLNIIDPGCRTGAVCMRLIEAISEEITVAQIDYFVDLIEYEQGNSSLPVKRTRMIRKDLANLRKVIDEGLMAMLRDQGFSDKEIFLALIMHLTRNFSNTPFHSMHIQSVLSACKTMLAEKLQTEFRKQIYFLYHSLPPKRKARDNMLEYKSSDSTQHDQNFDEKVSDSDETLEPTPDAEDSKSTAPPLLNDFRSKVDLKGAEPSSLTYKEIIELLDQGEDDLSESTATSVKREKVKTRGKPHPCSSSPRQKDEPISNRSLVTDEDASKWMANLLECGFQYRSEQYRNLIRCFEGLKSMNENSLEINRKKLKITFTEDALPIYHFSHGRRGSPECVTLIFTLADDQFELIAVAKHSGLSSGALAYESIWRNPEYDMRSTLSVNDDYIVSRRVIGKSSQR